MTISLSTAAKKEFDSEVLQEFQGAGVIRNAVSLRTNVMASTYQFNGLGKGTAQQKNTHEDVPVMDAAHTQTLATLSQWFAADYTDFFSNEEAPIEERQELVKTITSALGRRLDQLVIDQIKNATISYAGASTVAVSVGGANTGLNVAKLRAASKIMDAKGVPMNDRYLVAHSNGKHDLLADNEATSADFVNIKALINGDIDAFYGFKFVWIDNRDEEGGMPLATNTRENYAFHKSAIGLAIGNEVNTDVDWIPTKDSWLTKGKMRAGAIARNTNGLVLVNTYEA